MIDKYSDKKKAKRIEMRRTETGVAISEQKFDPDTGKPYSREIGETNPSRIDDLIADAERSVAALSEQAEIQKERIVDLKELKKDAEAFIDKADKAK